MHDIIIIGGGLAGLSNAILLAGYSRSVTVLEKGDYPKHKVCGEYVSNEVAPFLNQLGVTIPFETPQINNLEVTTPSGNYLDLPLDLGGFGISRYQLDYLLAERAKETGAELKTRTKAKALEYDPKQDFFTIRASDGCTYHSKVVIGSFGKLSVMDRHFNRDFFKESSPYVGVKYHLRIDKPADQIGLHHFRAGYCGISQIEDKRFCLCYLAKRDQLKKSGGIHEMEEQILKGNPYLRQIFEEGDFLWEKPLVINEISFAQKSLVEDHVLTAGDAAGMITPLCGNGMAMALHSAKMLAPEIAAFLNSEFDRQTLEKRYESTWRSTFGRRMKTGLTIQDLGLGNPIWGEIAVDFFNVVPSFAKRIIPYTHGEAF